MAGTSDSEKTALLATPVSPEVAMRACVALSFAAAHGPVGSVSTSRETLHCLQSSGFVWKCGMLYAPQKASILWGYANGPFGWSEFQSNPCPFSNCEVLWQATHAVAEDEGVGDEQILEEHWKCGIPAVWLVWGCMTPVSPIQENRLPRAW